MFQQDVSYFLAVLSFSFFSPSVRSKGNFYSGKDFYDLLRCLIKSVVLTSHYAPEKVSLEIFYNHREMFSLQVI